MNILNSEIEKFSLRSKEAKYFDYAISLLFAKTAVRGVYIQSFDHEAILDEQVYNNFIFDCIESGSNLFYVSTVVESEPIFEFDIHNDTYLQFYDLLTYEFRNEQYLLKDIVGLHLTHEIIKMYSNDFEVMILSDRYNDRCTLFRGIHKALNGSSNLEH